MAVEMVQICSIHYYCYLMKNSRSYVKKTNFFLSIERAKYNPLPGITTLLLW